MFFLVMLCFSDKKIYFGEIEWNFEIGCMYKVFLIIKGVFLSGSSKIYSEFLELNNIDNRSNFYVSLMYRYWYN